MTSALTSRILRGSLISAVAALGLSFTAAQAQPYYSDEPDAYSYDYAPGVTVYAHPYRQERSPIGAPIETVRISRVVDVSDLDLGTGYGRHVMRERVRRAATDACHELDMTPGFVPTADDSDVDCYHRAVDDALANAPTGVDVDYQGY
jgi:UrcA family protein